MAENKILIVIVSYNVKEHMQNCIRSIREKLEPGTYGMIVVDNASTDGIAKWLSEQDDIIFISNDKNVGFGPACNQAVRASVGTEYEDSDIFILNNDTILTSKAIPRLKAALYSSEDIGAVSPFSNYAGNHQIIDPGFGSVEEYLSFGEELVVPDTDRWIERTRLNGFAILLRRKVWDATGGFDEDFAPGYYEDDAISMEIQKLGYRLLVVRDSYIYHVGSAAFTTTNYSNLSQNHHKLFVEKYGFDLLWNVYPDKAVISQIPYSREEKYSVFEVGAGLGEELKAIKSVYRNVLTFGVEYDANKLVITEKTERVYENLTEAIRVFDAYNQTDKILLIVDENSLLQMNEIEKELLNKFAARVSQIIYKLHQYDEFPFENIKLVLCDGENAISPFWTRVLDCGIMLCPIRRHIDDIISIVQNIGISEKNILVISENQEFLEMVRNYSETILLGLPTIVPYINAYFADKKVTDALHKNMEKLDIFYKKMLARNEYRSQEAFLENSNIIFTINRDCNRNAEKIYELFSDSDKLNYTNNFYDLRYLKRLFGDDWNECAYICARDKYADYGIVGFYCFNKRINKLLHFAFSWQVYGMGLEKQIYRILGEPDIEKKKEDLPNPLAGQECYWLKENFAGEITDTCEETSRLRILIKGKEYLRPISDYLLGGDVTQEYETGDNYPSMIFERKYHVIIYSLILDDVTNCDTNIEELIERYLSRLDYIQSRVLGTPMIILVLGNDEPYRLDDESYIAYCQRNKELNMVIREYAEDNPIFRVLNVSDYIMGISIPFNKDGAPSSQLLSEITTGICNYINE